MQIYESSDLVQIIEFHTLYPERMMPNIRKTLSKYKRENIINLITNMYKLVNKPFYNPLLSSNQNDIDMIRFCFSKSTDTMHDAIIRYKKAKRCGKIHTQNVTSITESGILYILRELMATPENVANMDICKFEKDIFKCILAANQLSQPSTINIPFDEQNTELYVASLALSQYGIADIIYTDIDRTLINQTILCQEFFEWAKKDVKMQPLLDIFCKKYGLGSEWWLYPKSHWRVLAISNNKAGIVDFKNTKLPEDKIAQNILQLSSIKKDSIIQKKENRDFKKFRANPIIQLNNDEFLLFNTTLFIEHIYNSLYFELNEIANKHFGFESQKFNQYYTTEFSEKYLFDRTLKEIFSKSYDVTLTEEECITQDKATDAKNCGAPDFYARKGNIVILVENKDIHVKDTKREFGSIKDKIDLMYECLVTSHEGKRKALRQLLRNSERISTGEFQKRWDPKCPKDATIYPFIVVVDYKFSHPGLKNILEYWQTQQPENNNSIRPVVLADIATILLYKNQFKNKGLENYIEDYYKKTNIQPSLKSKNLLDYSNGTASFARYMQNTETTRIGEYIKKIKAYFK